MEIYVKSRKEYEDVLESARKIVDMCGRINVSEIHDLCGIFIPSDVESEYCKKGWDHLTLSMCYGKSSSFADGYFMVLPEPKPFSELDVLTGMVEPAEMVNHPSHYQSTGGIEVIDVMAAFTSDLQGIEAVDTSNVIKYICRWKNKNGVEDLKKARWYIDHLINKLEEESNK